MVSTFNKEVTDLLSLCYYYYSLVVFVAVSPQETAPLTRWLTNGTVHGSTSTHEAARWTTAIGIAIVIWLICTIVPSCVSLGIVVAHGIVAWTVTASVVAAALGLPGLVARVIRRTSANT